MKLINDLGRRADTEVINLRGHEPTQQMPRLDEATGPRRIQSPLVGGVAQPAAPAAGVTREELLAAVESSIVILKPGDTLVVRVPPFLDVHQVRDYRTQIADVLNKWRIPNHVLILPGEEFAKLERDAERPVLQNVGPQTGPQPKFTPSGPQPVLDNPA